jgi:hypothetical protein
MRASLLLFLVILLSRQQSHQPQTKKRRPLKKMLLQRSDDALLRIELTEQLDLSLNLLQQMFYFLECEICTMFKKHHLKQQVPLLVLGQHLLYQQMMKPRRQPLR